MSNMAYYPRNCKVISANNGIPFIRRPPALQHQRIDRVESMTGATSYCHRRILAGRFGCAHLLLRSFIGLGLKT